MQRVVIPDKCLTYPKFILAYKLSGNLDYC